MKFVVTTTDPENDRGKVLRGVIRRPAGASQLSTRRRVQDAVQSSSLRRVFFMVPLPLQYVHYLQEPGVPLSHIYPGVFNSQPSNPPESSSGQKASHCPPPSTKSLQEGCDQPNFYR